VRPPTVSKVGAIKLAVAKNPPFHNASISTSTQ
jgi:hypothetical protein